MEELEKMVNNLLEVKSEKVITELQKIGEKLITEYSVVVNENIVIHPLRLEAYYYNPEHFKDCSTHRPDEGKDPNECKKKYHFGTLYFITNTDGYPGIDICLSNGNYYLSFLIKNSYIENESLNYKQTNLYEKLKPFENCLENKIVLVKKCKYKGPVFKAIRVNINESHKYYNEKLAVLIEIDRKDTYQKSVFDFATGNGKSKIVIDYLNDNKSKYNTKEAQVAFCKQYLNEVPSEIKSRN